MTNHAIENGRGWLANIREMLTDMRLAESGGDWQAADGCRDRILESPLSVRVRGDWHNPGDTENAKPVEYEILLSTGGPALRIVGDLNDYSEAENARLQHQDWFKPWQDIALSEEEESDVLEFARQFYFG